MDRAAKFYNNSQNEKDYYVWPKGDHEVDKTEPKNGRKVTKAEFSDILEKAGIRPFSDAVLTKLIEYINSRKT